MSEFPWPSSLYVFLSLVQLMQERYTFASVLEVFLIVILAMYATVRRLGREIYAGQKVEELYFKALQCNKYSTI